MAVKHQLFISGESRKLRDFLDVTASDIPAVSLQSHPSEYGLHEAVPLAFDLASVVPLPSLSPSRAVVSVLDSEGETIKQARFQAWGTRELPTAKLVRFQNTPTEATRGKGSEMLESGGGVGDIKTNNEIDNDDVESVVDAVIEFRTNSGTLAGWASEAQSKYSWLEFKLLWVEWPGAQATAAHAYFPRKRERLACPSAQEIEKFVRFFGWVGDRGFNGNFFYSCPPSQSARSPRQSRWGQKNP